MLHQPSGKVRFTRLPCRALQRDNCACLVITCCSRCRFTGLAYGAAQMIKRPIPKGSFNAERAAMAAHVAAEAQRLYPKQIRFRFETSIQVCSTILYHMP